jgi:hypothetical protein
MSRSKVFWAGAETNQSPGSGPLNVVVDICDSLRRNEKLEATLRIRTDGVLSG